MELCNSQTAVQGGIRDVGSPLINWRGLPWWGLGHTSVPCFNAQGERAEVQHPTEWGATSLKSPWLWSGGRARGGTNTFDLKRSVFPQPAFRDDLPMLFHLEKHQLISGVDLDRESHSLWDEKRSWATNLLKRPTPRGIRGCYKSQL